MICSVCILSAVLQLRALLYVLCAFVILNKDYLLTYLLITLLYKVARILWSKFGRFVARDAMLAASAVPML